MNDLFTLLDEIQTIARNGLLFADNLYDRERYEKLMSAAEREYSQALELPLDGMRERFQKELGYITPKLGADAAIFNEHNEILLQDRADGSGWCLPCGWVEPNEKPAQAAIRETREETGLEVEVVRFVGIFSRHANSGYGPHSMIAIVHLCEVIGGELCLSHEGLGLRYWPMDAVPRWHANHQHLAQAALECHLAGDSWQAVSD
jgi:ADP-ribose pyrophosphatase YjhB (NUDIX family)